MKSRYTINDIAKMANVSHTTVSRALNGERYVSPETYERIMEICKSTGYMPNAFARKLKTRRSNTLGVLVPDIGNPFFSMVARDIEARARTHGYQVFIASSFYDYLLEERLLQLYLQNRVDGIIVSGAGSHSVETLPVYATQVPIVFIGDNIPVDGVSCVRVDNEKGTADATEYLLGLGHRKFAFVGGRTSSITHRLRISGFTDTLEKHGITDYYLFSTGPGTRLEDGYAAGCAYFKQKHEATAILAIGTQFAVGFMQAADEHGLHTPGDYSIIAFGEDQVAALPQISLSIVTQSVDKMTEDAFNILMRMVENDESEPVQKLLEPSLVIRRTCQPIALTEL